MTPITAFNQLMAEHTTRIARVNKQGWMWQASQSTGVAGVASASPIATMAESTRWRFGVAIVRVGEWLRGAPADSVADRASA